jgi:putative flippase GtrA
MLRSAEGRKLAKFALVGGLNTGVDFAVFCLLVYGAGMLSIGAQIVSYAAGLLNSYLWNRRWTFGVKKQLKLGEVLRFIGVNLLSFAVATALLLALEPWIGSAPAKALSIVISMAVNYVGYRVWVFRMEHQGNRAG